MGESFGEIVESTSIAQLLTDEETKIAFLKADPDELAARYFAQTWVPPGYIQQQFSPESLTREWEDDKIGHSCDFPGVPCEAHFPRRAQLASHIHRAHGCQSLLSQILIATCCLLCMAQLKKN